MVTLWLIFIYFQGNAQLVNLTDSKSGDPIFLAHVFIQGTSRGVVSNEDGEVNLSSFSDTDVITFSHIAYKKLQVKKPEIQNDQIALVPLDLILNEVIVSDISAFHILQNAISNHSDQIPSESFHTGYYREYVSANSEYTKYADGQLQYATTFSKDKNKYKVTPSVIQSRVFSPETIEEIDLDVVSPIHIKTLVGYNVVSSLGRFLNNENKEDYEYEFGASPNPDFYLIMVELVEGVEKVLYSAQILIHRETYLIHEIIYEDHPDFIEFSKEVSLLGLHIKLTGISGQLRFEQMNNVPYLKYGKVSYEMSIKTKKIDQINVFTSELLVYDFGTESQGKMKSYNKKSLYKSDGKYDENFWESGNSIRLSIKEKKLIEQVSKNP